MIRIIILIIIILLIYAIENNTSENNILTNKLNNWYKRITFIKKYNRLEFNRLTFYYNKIINLLKPENYYSFNNKYVKEFYNIYHSFIYGINNTTDINLFNMHLLELSNIFKELNVTEYSNRNNYDIFTLNHELNMN